MTTELMLEKLGRVDARGQRVYSAEQVRHVLPLIVLATKVPLDGRPLLARELASFQQRAGLTESMSDGEMGRAISRYYLRHPPAPALMIELRQRMLELVTQDGDTRASRCVPKRTVTPTTGQALAAPAGRHIGGASWRRRMST